MRVRADILALILALALHARSANAADSPPHAHPDPATVVIVTSSAVEAFEEAVRGIRQGLGPGVNVVVLDLAADPAASRLAAKDVRLLVTVGKNALGRGAQASKAPILATMLLRADLAKVGPRPAAGAVVVDVALADILTRMTKVLPGKTRAAFIRDPGVTNIPQSLLAPQSKGAEMSVKVVDCPRPEKLLESFLALRGQVDFVVCPPDGNLFNSITVRPLIRASLENRIPVVGFSESFVRTGAVAAVYPDYFEVGLQAGEVAHKFIAGGGLPTVEGPRKLKVAVNPRVARLLGLRVPVKNGSEPGIVVIE